MANYSEARAPASSEAEGTLSRRVYAVLRDDILAGRLKPGERLVRKTIGKRLGVSVLPVIEALYRLEIDGYVENRALAGCRVRPLTPADVDNDLMLREAVECQAARLCAERAAPGELDRLMKRAEQVDRFVRAGTPDPSLGSQLHWDFHVELARLSGCSAFCDLLKKVWFLRYMNINSLKAIRFQPPPDGWHRILVRQIRKGDPDAAERAMREHVRYGRKDDGDALSVYLKEIAAPKKKAR